MLVAYLKDNILNSSVTEGIGYKVDCVGWIVENYKYQILRHWEGSKRF